MAMLRRAAAVLGCAAVLAGCAAAACRLPGRWPLTAAAFLQDPFAATAAWKTVLTQQPTVPAQAETPSVPQPTAAPTPQPTPGPAQPTAEPSPAVTAPPDLQDAGPILERQFGQGSGDGYLELGAGSIKNDTDRPDSELAAALQQPMPFTIDPDSDEPQILILHTHATETYQPWDTLLYDPTFTARTTDTSRNMCAVGQAMADVLNEAGIVTLHDTTLHDSPSYTESYARSAQTARKYLEEYPSLRVVLDVHRDAIESDGARVKPVAQVDGEATAQVMIIAGCDNGTTVQLPDWQQNLRFAAAWEEQMEQSWPGLTRPVLCGYRFYNQDVCPGALLIEIGGHANTLSEALRAGRLAARALADLFLGS